MPDDPAAVQPAPVTAVVVNHDGGESVIACVDALYGSRQPLESVIVVDNASTDGSREALSKRFADLEVVELAENRGPAPARNAGLERASTPLVLLVDDDVRLAPDTLEKLIRAQAETGAAVVTPRVLLYPQSSVVQCDGADAHFVGTMILRNGYRELSSVSAPPAGPGPVGAVISSCLLVDRNAALSAGGFDPLYFIYFEDLEFSMRLRALGRELVCDPRAAVYHDRGVGTEGLSFRTGTYPARRAFLNQRNRWLTVLIHYRLRTLLLLLPALAAYECASFAFCVRQGFAAEWLRAWWSLLRNVRRVRERRARMQRERVRRDAELIVGGPLPLAPGVADSSGVARATALLSAALDGWWRLARRGLD